MAYERESIQRMSGYVPGKQPASPTTVKLNTNENPYAPSPAVMRALHGIEPDSLRRYPEPMSLAFRELAAQTHGVGANEIVAVNGGDELLRLAITTFVEPGRPIGMLEPSYSLYPVLAQIHNSPIIGVAAGQGFGVPEDFAARMNQAGVALTFLVNPHAPSGLLTSKAAIAKIARELNSVLLVDEAYVDFVDPERAHDLLPLLREHDNILFLRTMSKGYSLAGLRFGYGMGCASLIAPLLEKTRDSYNVDVVAQRLAQAAMADRGYAQDTWRRVREERTRVRAALLALGCLVPESQSNFLLAQVPGDKSAPQALAALEAGGILVRYFPAPRLDTALRITIGSPEQNDKLLSLLGVILR